MLAWRQRLSILSPRHGPARVVPTAVEALRSSPACHLLQLGALVRRRATLSHRARQSSREVCTRGRCRESESGGSSKRSAIAHNALEPKSAEAAAGEACMHILSQPTIGSDPRTCAQVRISLRDVASRGRWPSGIGTCQREGGTGRHRRTPLYAEAWNRSLEKHSLPVALDHHRRDLPCSVKVPHALSEHANGVSCHLVEADISVPGADKCSRYLCTAKICLFFACEARRKKPRCKQRGEIG